MEPSTKNIVKDFFFPTQHNNMTPGVLSRTFFLITILIGASLLFLPPILPISPFASLVSLPFFNKEKAITSINQSRTTAGLPALQDNATLDRAAEEKAKDMFEKQYFAHNTPDRQEPWTFFKKEHYDYIAAGENLAIDFQTAEEAHQALMNSPSHRTNILNPEYTEIGIAIITGSFKGNESILEVQFFGKPKPKSTQLATPGAQKEKPSTATAQSTQNPADKTTNKALPETASANQGSKPQLTPASNLLGTEDRKIDTAETPTQFTPRPILKTEIQITISLVIIITLFSLIFLLIRTKKIRPEILFRSFAVLLLFGYIAFGTQGILVAKTDSQAASIITPTEKIIP